MPPDYLTTKGTVLKTYFGQYLGQWLEDKGLLTIERCASGEGIFIYANGMQRTVTTGQAILAGAFAGCNVQLQHYGKISSKKDPIFNTKAHNPSKKRLKIKKRVISPPSGRFYRECKKQVTPARWLKPILRPPSGVNVGFAKRRKHLLVKRDYVSRAIHNFMH